MVSVVLKRVDGLLASFLIRFSSNSSSAKKMASTISNPISLYRYLLRQCRRLPPDAQPYYKNYVRQGFNSHSDENDPNRIRQIIERALEDAEWIVKKYKKK